jgi:hypothetical protein
MSRPEAKACAVVANGLFMGNYSVCYLDASGRTQGLDFLPFENDQAAVDFARTGIVRDAVVEVWREGDLVVRLYQKHGPMGVENAHTAIRARAAFVRADQDETLRLRASEDGEAPPPFLGGAAS